MPNLTTGIQTALSAILANSQAMEVIEHNVANASTPGYRRQNLVISAAVASPVFGMEPGLQAGQRGMGVSIESIQRFNLSFFDGRYRAAGGESSDWAKRSEILNQLEATMAETSDDGLIPHMDQFWTSWESVAADPTNTALRQQLLDQTKGLTDAFNRRSQQLAALRADQNLAISDQVDQINSMATQIADLNAEISHVLSVGEQPNDLMDKRDLLLDQLAQSTGAVAFQQKNGETIVSLDGHVLVSGHDAYTLRAEADPAQPGLYRIAWTDGQILNPPSGTLKGLFAVRDQVIPAQQTGLNQLAAQLVSAVNALHQGGYAANGANGLDFFDSASLVAGDEAATIKLNPNLDAASVATASAAGQPGSGDLATAIANLKNSGLMPGGVTMNDFYNTQVTSLGMEVQRAENNSTHNNLVFQALGDQRESVSGVNLDEEAAELAKFQKGYQAAARVMTAYDDLLDRIINGMGLVGRS
jgi:flagellar hook-associated protein 1 FlgK